MVQEPYMTAELVQSLQQNLIQSDKPLVIIGMMGAGKTVIGNIIADLLNAKFIDADNEIEQAAGQTINDIFQEFGEEFFRKQEAKVIARLLEDHKAITIISTGGGAYMTDSTRALIKEKAISIWLKADFDILWERLHRKTNRPMLKTENPAERLKNLLEIRNPIYAEADIVAECGRIEKHEMAHYVLHKLNFNLNQLTAASS